MSEIGFARSHPRARLAPVDGRAQRWASVGLLVVVVVVCCLSLVSARRLAGATAAARNTTRLSDLYQDARFFAASASDGYHVYLNEPQPLLRSAKGEALRHLSLTLTAVGATSGSDRVTIRKLKADVARYSQATDRVQDRLQNVTLTKTADAGLASDRRLADAYAAALTGDLGTLEEDTQVAGQRNLAQAATQASRLSRGTPAVLTASVILAFLIGILRRHGRAVEALASTDALTQLPNRLALARRAAAVLDRDLAAESPPCLLLLDLDRFKEVNDSLGHHYGDELLIQVARRLRAAVKSSDLVARLGGDEFAILLGAGGVEAGRLVAARVHAALEAPFTLNALSVEVGVSIGIAAATPDAGDLTALLRCADVAMYVAKETPDRFVVYTAEHDLHTADKVRLMSELRLALTADELVVHYQPKVALDDGRLVGVEALVRWQHPVLGLLQPGAFVPAVEDTELMDRVTTDVLNKALRQVKAWSLEGRSIPVAVNIPTRSLLNVEFPAQVAALLSAAGVQAHMLSLEITETSAMRDPHRCITVLNALRATGVRISIDDYGTGYASMAYLKQLPVDEIKIDLSFVSSMLDDPHSEILARSIVELGRNLGLTVVGEGVENSDVEAALRDTGCDLAQGYHYARPMAGRDLAAWQDAQPRANLTDPARSS